MKVNVLSEKKERERENIKELATRNFIHPLYLKILANDKNTSTFISIMITIYNDQGL